MAFDGLITNCIVSELNTCLIGGKINKIFEPNKNELLFSIYSGGHNYALCINISPNNYRLHLTTNSKPNPINAYNFCMALRKHLIGAKIKKIKTIGLERVVTIEFDTYNEMNDLITKKLIIELMGKHSNVILANGSNIIIDSLRHLDKESGSNRDILPAHPYEEIISNKLIFPHMSKQEFTSSFKNCNSFEEIKNALFTKFNGISKSFTSSIDSKFTIYDIYDYIHNTISSPYFTNLGKDYTISPSLNYDISELSLNFAIDDYYYNKESLEQFISYRNNLLKLVSSALQKVKKKLDNINKKLKECENMDLYRLYGELITANLYKIPSQNLKNIVLQNYYDENKEIEIPLDDKFLPSYNAKRYFKKYNKLKNASEIVNNQKLETLKEIEYIESIVYELNNASIISDLDEIHLEINENLLLKSTNSKKLSKKKEKCSNFSPLKFEIDGFLVYVGKNNKQNDYLTFKFAHKNDIWLHTKDFHGSHVIIETNGKIPEKSTMQKVANLTASHSSAKLSSKVPVDYTFVKYVKKPSGSKAGFVIYTNYKTILSE